MKLEVVVQCEECNKVVYVGWWERRVTGEGKLESGIRITEEMIEAHKH